MSSTKIKNVVVAIILAVFGVLSLGNFIFKLRFSEEDTIEKIRKSESYLYKSYVYEKEFRDRLFETLSNDLLNEDLNFIRLDSSQYSKYRNYFLSNVVGEVDTTIVFNDYDFEDINFGSISLLYDVISVNEQMSVNQSKVSSLLNEELSKSNLESIISYGDFIERKYNVKHKIDYSGVAILLFIVITVITIFLYIINSSKSKIDHEAISRILQDTERMAKESSITRKAHNAKMNALKYGDEASKEITELSESLDELLEENKALVDYESKMSVIKDIILIKAESLYRRSNLMLVLGLSIAVLGIVVFYYSISSIEYVEMDVYIISAIRPFFILLFIESISIYLLRQYRVLVRDYSYFFNIYLHKNDSTIINLILLNKSLDKDLKLSMINHISSFSYSQMDSFDVKNFEKSALSTVMKDLINK